MSLDGGTSAVTDELTVQIRELEEMMSSTMEERAHHGAQGRPSFGPEGGYQKAVPSQRTAAQPGYMPALGTLIISHARTTVPLKYDGIDQSKYVLWRRGFLSYLF